MALRVAVGGGGRIGIADDSAMSRLTCDRRKRCFRPRLTLEQAGHSGWRWVLWYVGRSGRLVDAGGPLVTDAAPAAAMCGYFDLLRRLGYRTAGKVM